MRVTIHGPNLNDQSKGTFRVHTAACRDNKWERRCNGSYDPWTLDLASRLDVCEAIYSDHMGEHGDDSPYSKPEAYLDDFHFAPCCDDLPTAIHD